MYGERCRLRDRLICRAYFGSGTNRRAKVSPRDALMTVLYVCNSGKRPTYRVSRIGEPEQVFPFPSPNFNLP